MVKPRLSEWGDALGVYEGCCGLQQRMLLMGHYSTKAGADGKAKPK